MSDESPEEPGEPAGRSDPDSDPDPDPDPEPTERALAEPTRSETRPDDTDGDDSKIDPGLYRRLKLGGVLVVSVLVLAAIAGAIAAPTPSTQSVGDAPDPQTTPEAFGSGVVTDRIDAEGEVTVAEELTVEGGHPQQTVLIEETGTFDQSEIRQLVRATTIAGHEVRFGSDESLNESLSGVDAYVLVAPQEGVTESELEAITSFTDRGGRLILLGRPDLVRVSPFGGVTTVETDMRVVASEYGIVFGNRYLYDTVNNDAGYRQVFAEPTNETFPTVPELEADRVVLSTATRVESRDGTVLLRTPETTTLSDGGTAGRYPVAVVEGNALAIGDTAFLSERNHNVADNEELVAYVAEFALGA